MRGRQPGEQGAEGSRERRVRPRRTGPQRVEEAIGILKRQPVCVHAGMKKGLRRDLFYAAPELLAARGAEPRVDGAVANPVDLARTG